MSAIWRGGGVKRFEAQQARGLRTYLHVKELSVDIQLYMYL